MRYIDSDRILTKLCKIYRIKKDVKVIYSEINYWWANNQ